MISMDNYDALVILGNTTTGTTWRFKVLQKRYESLKETDTLLDEELETIVKFKNTIRLSHRFNQLNPSSDHASSSSNASVTQSGFDSMSQITIWSTDAGSESNRNQSELGRSYGSKRITSSTSSLKRAGDHDVFLTHDSSNDLEEEIMPTA